MTKSKVILTLMACVVAVLFFMGTAQAGPIHDAVKNGNYNKVLKLLNANPTLINSVVSFHYKVKIKGRYKEASALEATPLHIAAHMGHYNIAVLLIKRGANINANDWGGRPSGATPLETAAWVGHKNIVQLLLYKGSKDIDVALSYAAQNNHKDIVLFLLSKGANINSRGKSAFTPLHCAVCDGSKDVVLLLLSKGANINARCSYGRTPLRYAILHKQWEIAKILRQHGGVE